MGVGLLGDALAARAGIPYEALLAERVLAPLGMDATRVAVAPALLPRLLPGHSHRGRRRPPLRDHMPAAGSLHSCADDMLRFLAACLDPPSDPPGPALRMAQLPRARLGRRAGVGLRWIISRHPRRPAVIWHNGGTWGFRSFAGLAPGRRRAAVVMTNSARGGDRLGFDLVEGCGPAQRTEPT
jgi:CubicO group peptidase (beta-lactamase class C family)